MEKTGVKRVLSLLPLAMSIEIRSIVDGRLGGEEDLGEIRLIAGGRCSIIHNREALFLSYIPSWDEVDEVLNRVCSGGTYAFRDTVKNGCGGSGNFLDSLALAYVYAPDQKFRMLYSAKDALSHGTLFEELYKPMEVYGHE